MVDLMMARAIEANHNAIVQAVELLEAGEVVAFATETVYGLGADTLNTQAIEKIYKLKGRPATVPLTALVLDEKQAQSLAKTWDERCAKLVERFWPGPLTIVLDRSDNVPIQAAAGLDTIAVRSPSHQVARQLLKEFGRSISAPSANRSGHISPTSAQHVLDDYKEEDDLLILDGGKCEIGIESTVLDLTTDQPRILRLGAITPKQLREVIGDIDVPHINEQTNIPGESVKHYSPVTPVDILDRNAINKFLEEALSSVVVLCFEATIVNPPHQAIIMPEFAKQYTAYLYEALRKADSRGAARIIIERPKCATGNWEAIVDRLERAATNANKTQPDAHG